MLIFRYYDSDCKVGAQIFFARLSFIQGYLLSLNSWLAFGSNKKYVMRQADIKSAQISITLLLFLPIVALPFKKTGLNQYNIVVYF